MQKFTKTKLAAFTAVVLSGGLLAGCSGTDISPGADVWLKDPKTDVVGKVMDAETNQPVKGAKVTVEGVDISATTDSMGNYILKDVPASKSHNGSISGAYHVMVSMSGVSSPVNMKTCGTAEDTTACYPGMSMMHAVTVQSAEGANGRAVGEAGVTNVNDIMVGKVTGAITGHVYKDDAMTLTDAATMVEVWADIGGAAGAIDEGTDVLVGTASVTADDTATTDVDEGMFSFSGLEGGFKYIVRGKVDGMQGDFNFGGATLTSGMAYDIDNMGHVVLGETDVTAPNLVHMSIAGGHDFASTDTVAVTFTFDEPIAADAMGYRDSIAAGGDLYEDVTVTYDGPKAGEIAKTITWNTDFDQLTVTVDSAAAGSAYSIDVTALGNTLEDAAGNTNGGAYAMGALSFTVAYDTGAPTAPTVEIASPASVTTANTIDRNGATIVLYWAAVSGANSYNVYRKQTVGGVDTGTVRIGNVATNTASDNMNDAAAPGAAVNGGIARLVTADNASISYSYTVTAVNGDGVEGAASTATSTVADNTPPASITAVCTGGASPWGGSQLVITFNEPVVQSLAENVANYTGITSTAPKVLSYDPATQAVTIDYNDTNSVCGAGGTAGATVAITDVAGNAPGAALTSGF